MDGQSVLRSKAESALRGARLLLLGRHYDSAASRAHFAVCLAMNAALGPLPAGDRRRRHGALLVPQNLALAGLARADGRILNRMYVARIRADYQIHRIGAEEAGTLLAAASLLLARMGVVPP